MVHISLVGYMFFLVMITIPRQRFSLDGLDMLAVAILVTDYFSHIFTQNYYPPLSCCVSFVLYFYPNPPAVTSGIRVGTPSTTTQGMGEAEMAIIAQLITRAIKTDDAAEHGKIKSEVEALVAKFPIYA